MSNEITANITVTIQKRSSDGSKTLVDYRSPAPTSRADMAGSKGPKPGAVTVPTTGVNVDFSGLASLGGQLVIHNQDATNYIEFGVRDTGNSRFYPIGKVGPGRTATFEISTHLGQYYSGTGTALAGAATYHAKADTASCEAQFDGFDA